VCVYHWDGKKLTPASADEFAEAVEMCVQKSWSKKRKLRWEQNRASLHVARAPESLSAAEPTIDPTAQAWWERQHEQDQKREAAWERKQQRQAPIWDALHAAFPDIPQDNLVATIKPAKRRQIEGSQIEAFEKKKRGSYSSLGHFVWTDGSLRQI
jgi:hypothetical protein